MENCLRTFQLAATFTGAIIGAGFATGREVMHFFGRFGGYGFAGAGLAILLFTLLGGGLYLFSQRLGARSYVDLLPHLGKGSLGKALDGWMLTMLLVSVGVMFAGGGTLLQDRYGLPAWVGAVFMAGLSLLILQRGATGLLSASGLLVPLMCLIPILLGLKVLVTPERHLATTVIEDYGYPAHWWSAACIYVVYNLSLGAGVIAALGHTIRDGREALTAAMLGGGLLGAVLVAMLIGLLSYRTETLLLDLPLLAIMEDFGPWWSLAFTVLLWLAMLTTAVANVHALACRLRKRLNSYRSGIVLCTLVGLLVGFVGFGELVTAAYPLFGYIGAVLLGVALVRKLFTRNLS